LASKVVEKSKIIEKSSIFKSMPSIVGKTIASADLSKLSHVELVKLLMTYDWEVLCSQISNPSSSDFAVLTDPLLINRILDAMRDIALSNPSFALSALSKDRSRVASKWLFALMQRRPGENGEIQTLLIGLLAEKLLTSDNVGDSILLTRIRMSLTVLVKLLYQTQPLASSVAATFPQLLHLIDEVVSHMLKSRESADLLLRSGEELRMLSVLGSTLRVDLSTFHALSDPHLKLLPPFTEAREASKQALPPRVLNVIANASVSRLCNAETEHLVSTRDCPVEQLVLWVNLLGRCRWWLLQAVANSAKREPEAGEKPGELRGRREMIRATCGILRKAAWVFRDLSQHAALSSPGKIEWKKSFVAVVEALEDLQPLAAIDSSNLLYLSASLKATLSDIQGEEDSVLSTLHARVKKLVSDPALSRTQAGSQWVSEADAVRIADEADPSAARSSVSSSSKLQRTIASEVSCLCNIHRLMQPRSGAVLPETGQKPDLVWFRDELPFSLTRSMGPSFNGFVLEVDGPSHTSDVHVSLLANRLERITESATDATQRRLKQPNLVSMSLRVQMCASVGVPFLHYVKRKAIVDDSWDFGSSGSPSNNSQRALNFATRERNLVLANEGYRMISISADEGKIFQVLKGEAAARALRALVEKKLRAVGLIY
jgi:hypothetical protein